MRVSKLVVTFVLAVAMAGCTTVDPYTGEEKTSSATQGAAIGAIAGAVVGIATGNDAKQRRKRALIGAGVGALSGAAIGSYMDRQERELRKKMEGTGVQVVRHGENITLNMPGNITFATDSASLNADFYKVLNGVSEVLKEYEKTIIEVAGHTDSRGSEAYNQRLSERRAASVARYLEAQDIREMRIVTEGYGENYPVATNETPEGRQQNRRVELTLAPLTEE